MGIFQYTQEKVDSLIADKDMLLDALQSAIDSDGGLCFDNEEDEVGRKACCGEISDHPHLKSCWVVKATNAIAKVKGNPMKDNSQHIDNYWYARGYYDGRTKGVEQSTDSLSDSEAFAYRFGYERGVVDFSDMGE